MNKTLVFGASLKPQRYSYIAIERLISKGIATVGFGLHEGFVQNVQIKTNIADFTKIDTITLYLNPLRQKAYYDAIIGLKPKRVIFNPGTENPEFYALLRKNNIKVEVACTLVLLATGQY